MFYDEALVRAIKNKLAPDMMTALQTADPMELSYPHRSINVPLYAGVEVLLNRKLGTFTVTATTTADIPGEWLHARQVFTTKELFGTRDRAQIIEYLMDELKKKLVIQLADEGLKELLRDNAEPPREEVGGRDG